MVTPCFDQHIFHVDAIFFLKKKHSNMVLPEEWWLVKILPKLAKYFFKRASNRKRTWNKSSQKQPTYLISQAHLWSLRWLPPPNKTLHPQFVSPEHTQSCNFDRLRCLLVDTPVSSSITSPLRVRAVFVFIFVSPAEHNALNTVGTSLIFSECFQVYLFKSHYETVKILRSAF